MVNDLGQPCHECDACTIRHGWLFARLSADETDLLVSLARPIEFTRRQILYSESERATRMIVVNQGVVKLTRTSADGRSQVLGLVYPGQLLGTEGFFSDHCETGAESLTAGRGCALPRDKLLQALRDRPEFALRLLEAMHQELRLARAQIQEMGRSSAEAKICALLCDLLPHLSAEASKEQDFPLAHQDLADILGLSRETISRAVGDLARAGVVSVSRQRVRVHDVARLRALAR